MEDRIELNEVKEKMNILQKLEKYYGDRSSATTSQELEDKFNKSNLAVEWKLTHPLLTKPTTANNEKRQKLIAQLIPFFRNKQ